MTEVGKVIHGLLIINYWKNSITREHPFSGGPVFTIVSATSPDKGISETLALAAPDPFDM